MAHLTVKHDVKPDTQTSLPPSTPHATRSRKRVVLGVVAAVGVALTLALGLDLVRNAHQTELAAWSTPAQWPSHTSDTLPERPVLIRFTASWCPPCQAMKRDVFSRTDIAEQIEADFFAVSVDIDNTDPNTTDLTHRYGIDSIPAFVVVDVRGHEITRSTGGMSPSDFSTFLKQAANAARPHE